MSMNLKCKQVNLFQTPSWVTMIALYNNKGKVRKPEETKYIYLEWVKSLLNGAWTDVSKYENLKQVVHNHIRELDGQQKLEFYEI